ISRPTFAASARAAGVAVGLRVGAGRGPAAAPGGGGGGWPGVGALSLATRPRRRRPAAGPGGRGRRGGREGRGRRGRRPAGASAKWWGTARKGTADNLGGMTGGISGAFRSVGTGPAVEWAKTAALAAGVAFAVGFGYAASKGLVGGVQENAASEATQNRIGTT